MPLTPRSNTRRSSLRRRSRSSLEPIGHTPPGIIAILLGAALVFSLLPKREDELRLLADYQAHDTTAKTASPGPVTPTQGVEE